MNQAISPIPPQARCINCGYSLYQLTTERCPECGRGFDRNDKSSMGIRVSARVTLFRRLQRPASRFTVALPWMATALILIGDLFPWISLMTIAVAVVMWVAWLLGHFPLIALRGYLVATKQLPRVVVESDRKSILRALIALAISWMLSLMPFYYFVPFWLYRSDLDRLAQRIPPTPVDYYSFGHARIGPYEPELISRYPHWLEIVMYRQYCPENWVELINPHGFSFVLEDDPDYKYDNTALMHLQGNWYARRW